MASRILLTQRSALVGSRLATARVASSNTARLLAVRVNSIFSGAAKSKTAKEPTKKELVAGKDIKATQFKVGLSSKKPITTVTLGFTKSNELFVGRMAMLGFAASLIGEILTGQGPIAQLGYEVGVNNLLELDELILFLIGFNLIAALLPTKGRFVPDEEELTPRPKGPLQDPKISLATPLKFLGVSRFGFTKSNELFVGRMAQLGFAASLIGEAFTGKGALAQFGLETGIPLNETEPLLLFFIAFTFLAAINPGTGKFIEEDA